MSEAELAELFGGALRGHAAELLGGRGAAGVPERVAYIEENCAKGHAVEQAAVRFKTQLR